MTGDMDDGHYAAVLAFTPDERFEYFVTTVCDNRRVFWLGSADDPVTITHASGRTAFPVWPHARLAAACVDEGLEGTEPASVDLDDFLEFLDRLQDENALAAVMMSPTDQSFLAMEPYELRREIEEWLDHAHDAGARPRD